MFDFFKNKKKIQPSIIQNKSSKETLPTKSATANTSENKPTSPSNNQSVDTQVKTGMSKDDFIKTIKEKTNTPSDLIIKFVTTNITIVYVDFLIDSQTLNGQIIAELKTATVQNANDIKDILPISEVNVIDKIDDCINEMLIGAALIHLDGEKEIVVAKISSYQTRGLSTPENESQVIDSQVGFNESLATNVSLIRRFITNPKLCNEKYTLGKETQTSLSMLYIKGIAPDEQVNTVRQRITDLEIDDLIDSAVLAELIDDSSKSIFPQLLLTERPDRFCDGLLRGKIGVIVNGSSMGLICPYTFIEFFQSREDQNLRWPIATFSRLLRFSAIMLSIFLTPIYIASLTFHYEIIPQPLLVPLSESRAIVPFPPIIEALILEIIIELLREAGARLPTKVGQTIGIVGGIVIGTAAVQAGITSNILIIIIALCALASFTMPNYMMGNVIRILRFPIMLIAGMWGFYGIMVAFCFLVIHLLRLTSLGAPYLSPFYPLRFKELTDSLVRFPIPFISKRAINSQNQSNLKKN